MSIFEAILLLMAYIIGIPAGIALFVFIISRGYLTLTGEAKRTPVKETLENSFGCVIVSIIAITFIIWILTL